MDVGFSQMSFIALRKFLSASSLLRFCYEWVCYIVFKLYLNFKNDLIKVIVHIIYTKTYTGQRSQFKKQLKLCKVKKFKKTLLEAKKFILKSVNYHSKGKIKLLFDGFAFGSVKLRMELLSFHSLSQYFKTKCYFSV